MAAGAAASPPTDSNSGTRLTWLETLPSLLHVHQPRPARQQQQLQHAGVVLGVADDQVAHGLLALPRVGLGDPAEGVEHLARVGREPLDGGRSGHLPEAGFQRSRLLVDGQGAERALGRTHQLGNRGIVTPGVLAHVEVDEAEAEALDGAVECVELPICETRPLVAAEAPDDQRQVLAQLVGARVAAVLSRRP